MTFDFLKEQLVFGQRLEGEGWMALVQRYCVGENKIQRSYKGDPVSDKG